jgi:hypothetical protein
MAKMAQLTLQRSREEEEEEGGVLMMGNRRKLLSHKQQQAPRHWLAVLPLLPLLLRQRYPLR